MSSSEELEVVPSGRVGSIHSSPPSSSEVDFPILFKEVGIPVGSMPPTDTLRVNNLSGRVDSNDRSSQPAWAQDRGFARPSDKAPTADSLASRGGSAGRTATYCQCCY